MIYYPTVKVRYSLFVLKVPLNPKQTNKQIPVSCVELRCRTGVQDISAVLQHRGLSLYDVSRNAGRCTLICYNVNILFC